MATTINLIVMGAGGVGKSALMSRYTLGRWVTRYDPTVEDSFNKAVAIDGKSVVLEILDTAGQEEYSQLRENFMHKGDAFMLVFSITDDQTFEDLLDIRQQVLSVHDNPKVPMILVGSKADMADERAVGVEEAERFAQDYNMDYIEVSSREDVSIAEAFELIVRRVMKEGESTFKLNNAHTVMGAGKAVELEDIPTDIIVAPSAATKSVERGDDEKPKGCCTIL